MRAPHAPLLAGPVDGAQPAPGSADHAEADVDGPPLRPSDYARAFARWARGLRLSPVDGAPDVVRGVVADVAVRVASGVRASGLYDVTATVAIAGAIEPCIVRARDAIDAGAPPRLVALYDVVARRRHLRSIRVDADEIVLRLSPATDPALVEDALCAVIDACRQPTTAAPPYR